MSDTGKIDELVQRANQPFECDLVVGFYDLTGYTQWAAQHPPLQVLTRLDLHFEKTAGYIKKSGGHFIKAIGDAGLFIYPGDSSTEIDHAVDAMQTLQAQTNEWLRSKSMATQLLVKMNWGPVACGQVGAPGHKRFDIYGSTVNNAALLAARPFAITAELHAELSAPMQGLFSEKERGEWYLPA